MLFFRRTDLADVEAMLRGGEAVDLEQVRNSIIKFVGDDDARLVEWDKLVQEVGNG